MPRIAPILLGICALPLAAEAGPAAADAAPPAVDAAPPSPWSHEGRIGLFINTSSNSNADSSLDATIADSNEYYSYQASFNGSLTWEVDPQEVEQTLIADFGRQKDEEDAWEDGNDVIDYDAIYRYHLNEHQRLSGAIGIDSVFTGKAPDNELFDPTLLKIIAGYGQEFDWKIDERVTSAEWRTGPRAQRRFGRGLGPERRDWEAGWELYGKVSYAPREGVEFWAAYEAFAEFNDPGHISNLLTGGIAYQLTAYITATLSVRGYYETAPEEIADDTPGYDEFSYMQDSMIGLTYTF